MRSSRRSQLRTRFRHNASTSSLRATDKPVRSFKSFMRTVPPTPIANPLPPSSTSQSSSRKEQTSSSQWRAPAEWSLEKAPGARSTDLRTYSPVLPKPEGIDIVAEISQVSSTALDRPSHTLDTELRDSGNAKYEEASAAPLHQHPAPTGSGSDKREAKMSVADQDQLRSTRDSPHSASPVRSDRSGRSQGRKAYASLGIRPSKAVQESLRRGGSPVAKNNGFEEAAVRRRRSERLRSMPRHNPLAVDDGWEDEGMDDETRELSFSQDYHHILTDQYRQLAVHPDAKSNSIAPPPAAMRPPADAPARTHSDNDDLTPAPLNVRKTSAASSNYSAHRSRAWTRSSDAATAETDKKSHGLSSLVPYRFSAASKRKWSIPSRKASGSKDAQTSPPANNSRSGSVIDTGHQELSTDNPPAGPVRHTTAKDAYRFSAFYPRSPPVGSGQRMAKGKQRASFNSQPDAILRLPGGLALVRSPQLRPASTASTPQEEARPSPQSSVHPSTLRSAPRPRASLPQSQWSRSSSASSARDSSRHASSRHASSRHASSRHASSRHASSRHASSRHTSSRHASPRLQPSRHDDSDAESAHERRNIVRRAREARRQRLVNARQERLKQSIKVLGPTDPRGVAAESLREGSAGARNGRGEVASGRVPGYTRN